MKIAALYAFWEGEMWSTPQGIINALERLGHQVESFNLYHSGQRGHYSEAGLFELINRQNEFDFMIHFDYGAFNSGAFKYITIPTILEAGDEPQSHNTNLFKSQFFDITLTPDFPSLEDYRQKGIHAYFWTHHADTDIYRPIPDIKPDKFLVTTVDEGRGNGLIRELRKELGSIFLDDRYFYGLDHSKFMARGIAVLQKSQWGEITRRPFEAMACGKLVFADRLAPERNFESLFRDGEEIIYYDNFDDLINKVRYYESNLDKVQRIATNGYNTVIKYHTADHRVKELLDYVKRL